MIGSTIRIMASSNQALVGLNGRVRDETKNMILLDDGTRIRHIPKDCITIWHDGIKIKPQQIAGRPYERVSGP